MLSLAALPAAAQAPPEVRLEAGYANVRQAGIDANTDAALLAAFWRKPTDRWTFFTSGNLTYARDSLAAAQGVAAFSFPWLDRDHLRTDIGVAGATFSLRSTGRGGNGNGFMRNHYVRDQWGAWLGGAAKRTYILTVTNTGSTTTQKDWWSLWCCCSKRNTKRVTGSTRER